MTYKFVALGPHSLPGLGLESIANMQQFVIEMLYGSISMTWRCM